MNEKELEKSLNKTVKPGTEQVAINTAQNQANQLLTEQRMNLQSERQVMTSNSERDTELRGAIEIGAMNAAEGAMAQQPQQVALPPQAAGLRPETQQLLAKYGVNPSITESAKTTSNSTQSRAANTKTQVLPNRATGGETRVTNTTNITNITNNNSRVETRVDIPKQPAVLPPGPPARLAPIAAGAGAGMAVMAANNKFKNFLNNLFAKRDRERQLQEREFRRRDWSIQRMTRKVMDRMNNISEKFARNMNPEKIGSTFTSQIKLFLGMVGLTLLPKVWPAIVGGINKVGEFLSDIKTAWTSENGGFLDKLGAVGKAIADKVVTGVTTIGGTLVGAVEALADRISDKIKDALAGNDYTQEEKDSKGILGLLGDRLVEFFGADPNVTSFSDLLKGYVTGLFDQIKKYMEMAAEDRAVAIKKAAEDISWDPDTWFEALPKLLSAAVGGTRGLSESMLSDIEKSANDKLIDEADSDNVTKNIWNGEAKIKNGEGMNDLAQGMVNLSNDWNDNNATALNAGAKALVNFSMTDKALKENKPLTLNDDDIRELALRMNPTGWKNAIARFNEGLAMNLWHRENNKRGQYDPERDNVELHKSVGFDVYYDIPIQRIPTFIGILKGIEGVDLKNNYEHNAKIVKEYLNNKDELRADSQKLDSQLTEKFGDTAMNGLGDIVLGNLANAVVNTVNGSWRLVTLGYGDNLMDRASYKDVWTHQRSEYADYNEYSGYANEHDERMKEQGQKVVDATLIPAAVDRFKAAYPGLFGGLDPRYTSNFNHHREVGYMYGANVNHKSLLHDAKNALKGAYNTVTGSEAAGKVGELTNFALKESDMGNNSYYPQQGQVQTPLALPKDDTPTTVLQRNWLQGGYNHIPVQDGKAEEVKAPTTAWSDVSTDAPSAAVAASREGRKVFSGEIKRNNPGNIRTNDLKGFNTYESLDDGFAAMFNKLIRWFQKAPSSERAVQLGVAGKPANSINEFIRVWAPASDNNDEENYVKFVEDYTGIRRDHRLDPNSESDMKAIVEAMTIMEHTGSKALTDNMLASLDKGWEKRSEEVKVLNLDAGANPILAQGEKKNNPLDTDKPEDLLASLGGTLSGYLDDFGWNDAGLPIASSGPTEITSFEGVPTSNLLASSITPMPSTKIDAVAKPDNLSELKDTLAELKNAGTTINRGGNVTHSDNSVKNTVIHNHFTNDLIKQAFVEVRT